MRLNLETYKDAISGIDSEMDWVIGQLAAVFSYSGGARSPLAKRLKNLQDGRSIVQARMTSEYGPNAEADHDIREGG